MLARSATGGIAAAAEKQELVCPECKKRVPVRASEVAAWRACSDVCEAKRRRNLKAWCPLHERILGWVAENNATVVDFSRQAGVKDTTVRDWFRHKWRELSASSVKGH